MIVRTVSSDGTPAADTVSGDTHTLVMNTRPLQTSSSVCDPESALVTTSHPPPSQSEGIYMIPDSEGGEINAQTRCLEMDGVCVLLHPDIFYSSGHVKTIVFWGLVG